MNLLARGESRLIQLSSEQWQTITVAMLGLSLLLLVGFAPMQTVHNAAHDARHSISFPCH